MIDVNLLHEATNDWRQVYIELDLSAFTGAQITTFFSTTVGSTEWNAMSDFKQLVILAVKQANPDLKTEGIRMWRSTLNTRKWLCKVYFPKTLGQYYEGIPASFQDNVRIVGKKYSDIPAGLITEYNIGINAQGNYPRLNVWYGVEK
jgi:hypothetical protein